MKSLLVRYGESGLCRYYFALSECQPEVQQFFASVTVKPIQFQLPFARRTIDTLASQESRVLQSFPLLNKLGQLIPCAAG